MNREEYQAQLVNDIFSYAKDPLGYVMYAFPWGESELENTQGPRKWQREVLSEIGKQLKTGNIARIAIAAGHSIGKTALTAMVQKWALDTLVGTRGQVTANTGQQLKTKTWAELAKWNRLSVTNDWFEITSTSIYSTQEKYKLDWRSDISVWRENRTEAFAGFHNYFKRILIILDEASGIPQAIWDTVDSFFLDKDTEIICLAFGNPLNNSGGFYELFHNEDKRKIWKPIHIDARTVEGVSLDEIEKMKEIHGEDSDYFKVRVRGMFPNASTTQFIPNELCMTARKRTVAGTVYDPLVAGIDFALGGNDNCVIYYRRGLDGKSIPPTIIPGNLVHDATKLADILCEDLAKKKPDVVFGDKGAMGGPIINIMNKLGFSVVPVNFGGEPSDKTKYFNKAAEMASTRKQWMYDGGAIWDDPQLHDDLCQREYGSTLKGQLRLETKDDMKKRGLESPDISDALDATFAHPVVLKGNPNGQGRTMKTSLDYLKLIDPKNNKR